MKSGKQRRQEIKRRRLANREKAKKLLKLDRLRTVVKVRPEKLKFDNSYGVPRFVDLGYYEDIAFICKDCGKDQIWRDTQQKWWYEVMQGGIWTTANRCRACRIKERSRKDEARRVHKEGLKLKGKI